MTAARRLKRVARMPRDGGFVMLEVLMALLIFALGILGMVGVSAMALNAQSDAQYRADAAGFANEIAQRIWLGVDRTNNTTFVASLATFQHLPTEATPGSCVFSGTASAAVADWIAAITTDTTRRLPGATTTSQQILVNSTAGNYNSVQITICWQTPGDAVPRRHTLVTLVN